MSLLRPNKTIWIDLDNSPHVPFFVPIIGELQNMGHSVVVTVRDTFQVVGLADLNKLNYLKVGKHYGALKLMKIIGTVIRSIQLASAIREYRPDVAISHGSRSLQLVSSVFGIPSVLLFDYEFARSLPFIRPVMGIVPEVLRDSGGTKRFKHGLRMYSGIKEDVYVSTLKPDSSILKELSISSDKILVTIRPPANEAHYHNPESDELFFEAVSFLGAHDNVQMVILPRNEKTQRALIVRHWPEWVRDRRIIIPDRVVDGLNLIWHSDFVISGGGTMNREAAALRVPVYSIFRGPTGAVDKYLAAKGRLVMIETGEDVKRLIRVSKRDKVEKGATGNGEVLNQIMAAIGELIS